MKIGWSTLHLQNQWTKPTTIRPFCGSCLWRFVCVWQCTGTASDISRHHWRPICRFCGSCASIAISTRTQHRSKASSQLRFGSDWDGQLPTTSATQANCTPTKTSSHCPCSSASSHLPFTLPFRCVGCRDCGTCALRDGSFSCLTRQSRMDSDSSHFSGLSFSPRNTTALLFRFLWLFRDRCPGHPRK